MTEEQKKITRNDKCWLICAALFAIIVTFANLGSEGMYAAQEGRTAIITRNMLLSGNYLDMNVRFGIPYEKPVGHYWLCLPFAKLFSLDGPEPAFNAAEWALRLPSALSALLAVAVAGLLAFKVYSPRTGAITMIVLSSMMTFCHLARLAHIDMPLAASFACAMYFLYMGYFRDWKCNHLIYGFYAFLGWGMVLKGPLVVILAGLVVVAMMCWSRRWKMIWELRPLTGGLVFLLVALPWYVVEIIRTDGKFFDEFIINQNIRRFTGVGSTYRDGERMPLWYYFPKLFAGALPWSIASVGALVFYFRKLIRMKFRPDTVFFAMWFLTGFIFFSFSALKRGDYLLPVYPALAILTARAIDLACQNLPKLSRRWVWGWGILAGLTVLLLAVNWSGILIRLGNMVASRRIRFISRRDGMNLTMFSEFINEHILLAAIGIVCILAVLWLFGRMLEQRKTTGAFWILACVVLAFFMGYYCILQPGTDRLKTVKPFVLRSLPLIPRDEAVVYTGDFNTEMIFFMNRPYEAKISENIRFVIASPEVAARMKKEDPERWQELYRTPDQHQYPAVMLKRATVQTL